MNSESETALRRADLNSEPVILHFAEGDSVLARIRELDWTRHRVVTYLDMDNACCACTADLDAIVSVQPAGAALEVAS